MFSLPKQKKSPFYRWLIKQKDRQDPIGDLSNDVQKDQCFPREIGSLEQIKSYLISQYPSNQAIQALGEAYKEFKNNKTVRSGFSLSQRFDVFRRDNYRCQICGATALDAVCLEVDHKNPVANGGGDEMSNLWTLCFSCNRGKGKKNL